jgi:hypothetical protein
MDKKDLIDGAYYTGNCRNANVARWDAATNRFYHWRMKFGNRFVEWIFHPDDEKYFDVFEAEALCDNPPAHIPLPHEAAETKPEGQQ